MAFILALDQGTTSCRSILFDRQSRIVAFAQKEFTQIFPRSGWVEHDPEEIWQTQLATAKESLQKAGVSSTGIAALGITNQRETAIIWERKTGGPIYNAIVWQDRRTSDYCSRIKSAYADMIRSKTGLEVDAYFSASKIAWLLENVKDAKRRAEAGELAFGTIDTWLIWRLTGGRVHATDVSNAARTMLFDINSLRWDDELLQIFDIPKELLPEVRSSSEIYGQVSDPSELRGIPIAGVAGDQQAALFGQGCFEPGSAKNTYGTGCFLLQNTGETAVESKHRLLTTVAWRRGSRTTYALEGSVFIGGAVIQWLRDSLGIINSASDVELLAGSVPDNGGVYFVPAFVGLGTPHWDQDARGLIIGLTRGTGRAQIARAAVESIAFQTADLLSAMRSDSHSVIRELRVDGGATANTAMLQFQADLLQTPVVRSAVAETTALGAAYLAGLATNYWDSENELAGHWRADARFEPAITSEEAVKLLDRWHEAVSRARGWAISCDISRAP